MPGEGEDGQAPDAGAPKAGHKKVAAFAILLLGLAVGLKFLPVNQYLAQLLEWTRSLGAWGPVAVGLFYIPACLLMLPGSVITLGAGILFGVLTGTVAVSLGSTAGACAAFLVGRTVARDWISLKMRGNARFSAVSDAVAREGFKVVLLTRLSPVFPFNLLNYAYGLTAVPFWKYALASWIGMFPGTILYVYIGSTITSVADLGAGRIHGGTVQTILKWAGLAVTILVVVFVTRLAQKALREATPPRQNQGVS